MKYHMWTADELAEVRQYVKHAKVPLASMSMNVLASRLNLPVNSVRGAINRALRDLRS